MKRKLVTVLLCISMMSMLIACGSKEENIESSVESTVESTVESSVEESSVVEESSEVGTEATEESNTSVAGSDNAEAQQGAFDVLKNIWDKFADDQKFPAAGGDFSEENSVMDGPGKYTLTDPEAVDAALGFPADLIDKVDGAASLMHMMNANTFTGAAYHLVNAGDVETVAESVKEHILNRQWMCGFPEKLVIISIDDYVITAFGKNDPIANFVENATVAYENATVLVEEVIE